MFDWQLKSEGSASESNVTGGARPASMKTEVSIETPPSYDRAVLHPGILSSIFSGMDLP